MKFSEEKRHMFSQLDEGSFVEVFDIHKNDNPSVLGEKKFIIKKYKKENLKELSEGDMSTEETLNLLRRRYFFTKEFYKELPDLVLRSRFFIGKDEDGSETIFDVQQKIENYKGIDSVLDQGFNPKGNEVEVFSRLFKEQLQTLRSELIIFINRTKDFLTGNSFPEGYSDFSSRAFDFNSGNVVITSEGHLSIIDTNIYKNLWEEESTFEQFEHSLADLENVLKILELKIKNS